MFKIISSAFVAAHIILSSFTSVEAKGPLDCEYVNNLRVFKVNTKDIYSDGEVHKFLWDDHGPKSLGSYGIKPKPGGKFVWNGDPICPIRDQHHEYLPSVTDIKYCAEGTLI